MDTFSKNLVALLTLAAIVSVSFAFYRTIMRGDISLINQTAANSSR